MAGFNEEVAFKQRLWNGEHEPWGILGNRSQERENIMSKGSKAEAHLAYSRNRLVEEESVDKGGWGIEKEVTEETRARLCRVLQAMLKDSGFNFELAGTPLKGSKEKSDMICFHSKRR